VCGSILRREYGGAEGAGEVEAVGPRFQMRRWKDGRVYRIRSNWGERGQPGICTISHGNRRRAGCMNNVGD
jgi:hypothetical protein